MGMPNIPDIGPAIDLKRKDVINLLLASIGLEELGLAHILNAEGEKIQCITGGEEGTCGSLEDLLAINSSVNRTIQTVIKNQMLLQFKFENILDLIDGMDDHGHGGNHGGCHKDED